MYASDVSTRLNASVPISYLEDQSGSLAVYASTMP